jgi:endonuclease/exonuclease/phosphatase family metal-dependent hydrolase
VTLRSIAPAMDPLGGESRLSTLINQHQWLPGETGSLAGIEGRHTAATRSVRTLWYNTWLLPGVFGVAGKPDREARAREIGATVRNRYDLIALGEVFDGKEAMSLLSGAGWLPGARFVLWEGPSWSSPPYRADVAGSLGDEVSDHLNGGCITMAKYPAITMTEAHWRPFVNEGDFTLIDSWAGKGILRCVVNAGGVAFLMISTHFVAGEAPAKMAEVDELVAFLEASRERDPALPTVVVGDFNLRSDAAELYGPLSSKLEASGFRDLWAWRHPGAWAPTGPFDREPNICPLNPSQPLWCVDDTAPVVGSHPGYPGYRIDYVFLERPRAAHRAILDCSQPRRVPFLRGAMKPPIDGDKYGAPIRGPHGVVRPTRETWRAWWHAYQEVPPALSDHLGLEFTLFVNPID